MKNSQAKTVTRQESLSILYFSLFSGWLLAVPFQGKILDMLMKGQTVDSLDYGIIAVISHFAGLFVAGFLLRPHFKIKRILILSALLCVLGSLVFYLPFSLLWYASISLIGFLSGVFVAGWGLDFKELYPRGRRLKSAASVLIYSNLIMIFLNLVALKLSPSIALFLSIVSIIASIIIIFKIESLSDIKLDAEVSIEKSTKTNKSIIKAFLILSLFIFIISINSGFMYRLVNPTFSGYEFLTSYYWAIPYILAILTLRNMPDKFNRVHILYVGLAMIGISYIAFMWLQCSVANYLFINTLMLGAFGIYDLFLWSMLGNFLDYTDKPIHIFGIGLSMNVLGILIGALIGNLEFIADGDKDMISSIALAIIFIVLIILPLLNTLLSGLFKSHKIILGNRNISIDKLALDLLCFKDKLGLTDREIEIIELLLKGYTYKAVSENLYISENTVKYHIKNIYQKCEVKSKMELINRFKKD